METETTTESAVDTSNNEGEGNVESISVPKKDYDTLNQTLGSLKKELKDLKKSQVEKKEEPTVTPQTKSDDIVLQKLERLALRGAGISHQDDVDLAHATAKKWGMDIDEVLVDEDFKLKLERQQATRSNAVATSNIRGGETANQTKNTPEFWIAKGTPPTPQDIPDSKARRKIAVAFLKAGKGGGKTFYNE